jgi:GT2 family glycosyltransferase
VPDDRIRGGPGVSEPSFSIVVPTFRRPEALRETLVALTSLDYEPDRYEVIVVDDGDDDETARVIESLDGHSVVVRLDRQRRLGAARARNRGAGRASGDFLLFCDDDMVLAPSDLRERERAFGRHGDVAVAARWEFSPAATQALMSTPFGRYRIDLERHFQREAAGEPADGDPECLRMELVAAASLSLGRERFAQLGGFDESFPFAGAEDQDFSLRARAAGMTLLLDTRICALHNDSNFTLSDYCARERRSAQTVAVLARKYPTELSHTPYVLENRPIQAEDPPRLKLKKLVKAGLGQERSLSVLRRLVGRGEQAHLSDRTLRRLYRRLLGLHLFRGFRQAWTA